MGEIMKNIRYSRSTALVVLYICLILLGIDRLYINNVKQVSTLPVNHKVIALDAGHGGKDPGKVAQDGTEEKGINLEITKKLQAFLEEGGAVVINTRVSDNAVGENKRMDLKNRVEITKANKADMLVSIHQNSYPQDSVKGAQVFYNKNSEASKQLAYSIQKRLKDVADSKNDRVAKANANYYILKQVDVPAVIVECGFLSNSVEKQKLTSSEYQEKIAWAIYMGILEYYGEDIT